MSEAAHVQGHGHGHPRLAHHFGSMAVQSHAARLGMWLFLSTEILLFTGLFVAYSAYRFLFPAEFLSASHHLSITAGTVNTLVLITSSLTVALAFHYAQHNHRAMTVLMLVITILFALAFLVIKAFEWTEHFREGALPGRWYHFEEVPAYGGSLFYTLYFLMTGLHGFHVVIGMLVISWVTFKAWRGEFSDEYSTPVELAGMYWHLVDLIWIFIYPLLYLL